MKKILLTAVSIIAVASAVNAQILAWDFTGEANVTTSTAELVSSNLTASVLSRGSGAAASAGNNSFRTTGFQNNGINVANTDYFEFTLTAATGYALDLTSISARFGGTAAFSNAGTGVTMAFAYNIGSGYVLLPTFSYLGDSSTSSNPVATATVNLSGVTALQDLQTVTFRFYASGQTTTGGWGFNNNNTQAGQQYGLAIAGAVTPVPEPSTYAMLFAGAGMLVWTIRRRRTVG